MIRRPPRSTPHLTLSPSTPLFRSQAPGPGHAVAAMDLACELPGIIEDLYRAEGPLLLANEEEKWLALGGVTGTQ